MFITHGACSMFFSPFSLEAPSAATSFASNITLDFSSFDSNSDTRVTFSLFKCYFSDPKVTREILLFFPKFQNQFSGLLLCNVCPVE